MTDDTASVARALRSLRGLAVGDAFGEKFMLHAGALLGAGRLPPPPWRWTDDTHMALSIVDELSSGGVIDQDRLAGRFASRHAREPWRGYAGGAARLLRALAGGADWKVESPALFGGGSWGNGAAMRAAPIGAYFSGNPGRAAEEAERSAAVTHAHVEGRAGAVAVATAAALIEESGPSPGAALIERVAGFLPVSRTRDGLAEAAGIPAGDIEAAVDRLGTGDRVSAMDTVPFCLWVAAYNSPSYERALVTTAGGLGDCDTTCAIVGGIVAVIHPVPEEWIARTEPLPPKYAPPER